VLEFGNPKEAICEAAEKLGVDMLVVGSHGKGALQRCVLRRLNFDGFGDDNVSYVLCVCVCMDRTFLGSVSNYCVNNAKCPVLVVRTKA